MVLRHRCFPLKCCCWVLAMLIAIKSGGRSQEFYTKDAEDENCKIRDMFKKEFADDVVVLTVATEANHGFQRFMRSAETYGIQVDVLGMNQKETEDQINFPGGGMKINLLRKKIDELLQDKDHQNKIVLFTDSYDVMFLGPIDDILDRFHQQYRYRVLFSAEQLCWPDPKLAPLYPNNDTVNPYLNSGAFIGYLPEIGEILNYKPVNDKADDQLYYSKIYLNKKLREKLRIGLDHNAEIFQNLNGGMSDVKLRTNTTQDWPYLENVVTKTIPLIVHGNGPSKLNLNSLGNYLAKSWSLKEGCAACAKKRFILQEDNLPTIMVAVFIETPTPFLEEFLEQILAIDYPKSKINLFLRNSVEYHETEVDNFFRKHHRTYSSAKRIMPDEFISESEARNIAKDRCAYSDCQYIFSIDSLSRVDSRTLRDLLATGYDVVAPMLVRPGHAWSNFWGAINSAGYYARSSDYMDIVQRYIRGIWNVPFITNCYLVKMSALAGQSGKHVTYDMDGIDADIAFCSSLRKYGIFMHVDNERDYGHLVNPESFDVSRAHPDIYQVIDNPVEWEARYLNVNYSSNFEDGRVPLQPCPDVYWFPLMSTRFCVEWVEIMETFGKWSDGTNNDERIEGGYEAVPTRDIHMTQVGLDKQWLHILRQYVRPLQEMVFTGYYSNLQTPRSVMNFVVRYRPEEQPSLRPHHDSSTYTINLALNTPHADYEGGGCRFLRYDCSVRDTRQGWLLMHPGRLTHFHEGLQVTNGTRYIMISFVDP